MRKRLSGAFSAAGTDPVDANRRRMKPPSGFAEICRFISFRTRQWTTPMRTDCTGSANTDMLSCRCKNKKADGVYLAAPSPDRKGGNTHEKRIPGFTDRHPCADRCIRLLRRKIHVGKQRMLRLRFLRARLCRLYARLRCLHRLLRDGRLDRRRRGPDDGSRRTDASDKRGKSSPHDRRGAGTHGLMYEVNCAARMKEDSPAGESLDCGGRMRSAPTGSLARMSRTKSPPCAKEGGEERAGRIVKEWRLIVGTILRSPIGDSPLYTRGPLYMRAKSLPLRGEGAGERAG